MARRSRSRSRSRSGKRGSKRGSCKRMSRSCARRMSKKDKQAYLMGLKLGTLQAKARKRGIATKKRDGSTKTKSELVKAILKK